MSARAAVAALAVACTLAAGCFDHEPAPGRYRCGPDRSCPPGQYCAPDQLCWSHDHSSCSDGVRDASESDVDCGGGDCPGCAIGQLCTLDRDCDRAACATGADPMAPAACRLATAPPYWQPVSNLPQPRVGATVLADAAGKIYAIGGSDGQTLLWPTFYILDVRAGLDAAWSTGPNLVLPRSYAVGGVLNGLIYMAGGYGNEQSSEKYDPATNTWNKIDVNFGFDVSYAGYLSDAGTLVAVGGVDGLAGNGAIVGTTHKLKPDDAWSVLQSVVPRREPAAVLADNQYFVIGGSDGSHDLASVQIYSKATGRWSDGPPLPVATTSVSAALAADGRIFVAGGSVGGVKVGTVYAMRPGQSGWESIAPLMLAHSGAGAVTAADGRVYVVGGGRENLTGTNVVEAYGPVVNVVTNPVPVGIAPMVGGNNFAARAHVTVYAGSDDTGTPVQQGDTDDMGTLQALALPPASAPGAYPYTFEDNRSRYPVNVVVQVVPAARP